MLFLLYLLAAFGVLLLLIYFGKTLILLVAFFFAPFVAAYRVFTAKSENKTNDIIIAICGFIVLSAIAFFYILFSAIA